MRANIFRVMALLVVSVSLFVSVFAGDSHYQYAKPIEVILLRTEGSKTWDLGNGKYAVDTTIGSIHYKNDYNDSDEIWKEIDTTIVNSEIKKAPYDLKIDGYSIYIKDKRSGSEASITLKDIVGENITVGDPSYFGNLAIFEDVAKDTDIIIQAQANHVYFMRVLKSPDAPLTATFAVYQSGDGIKITPKARDANYNDIQVCSSLEDGLLTETLALNKVGEVEYPIQIDPTVDVFVSASTDDILVYWTGGAWIPLDVAYVYAGYNTAAVYKTGVGFRFLNITIPASSTIDVAYMNLTCNVASAGTTVNTRFTGNKELNPATFSTVADYQGRRGTIVGGANDDFITTNQVDWDNIAAWTLNNTYQSSSIVAIVQELIDQVGWASGNDMAIFWDDHDDRSTHAANCFRSCYTYNSAGITTRRPLLHIEYTPMSASGPTMDTLRCTGFGKDWLILNGNVTAYGTYVNITQLGFNYGTTTSYGSSEENTYANYTITSYGYYTFIDGLNEQTKYHYRANGFNGAWGYGGDRWFSTAGAVINNPMEWESNISTANTTWNVYGSNWAMQSFTTNDTAHTLMALDLWLRRMNSPGDVTVTLQKASGGLPYGTILSTGTIAAQYTGNINPVSTNTTTRYTVPLDTPVSLSSNTQYCITIKALMGDVNNYLQVGNVNTGTYTYGSGYTSSDNGLIWTDTLTSFGFDLWGFSCLQVDYANVFNSFKDDGDWLIVFFYRNTFPPYYPIQDSKQYFAYQLIDEYNEVRAQTSCQSWGAKPGSIYLSADTISSLEWSGNYRVRLINVIDGTVYMEYALQSKDWLGDDLTLLDSWALSMAQQLQVYDNTPYITAVAGRGDVLNSAGGVIFATGIPLLDVIRPNLFQIVSTGSTITNTEYPQTLRQAFQPATMLGEDAWGTMVSIGNVLGLDGRTVGAIGLLIIVLVIAGWGFQPGHTVAATVICMPLFIIGMVTGLIDLLIGAVGLAIATIIFIWKSIFQGG